MDRIKQTQQYIHEILKIQTNVTPVAKNFLDKLPLFIHETYRLYKTQFFNTEILLAELKNEEEFSILQTEKHINLIKNILHVKVAIVLRDVPAYNRKRLIEKSINFIVPGKQLFLPELLMDLRESYPNFQTKKRNDRLLPSAQFLLIYQIIHKNGKWKLEEHTFKEIAKKLDYTPMAISNAVHNLKNHELVEITGEKEKHIHFVYERKELWNIAAKQNLLINPISKTVFVDEKPKEQFLLFANASALPEYTNLNPDKQEYYAIEKSVFYGLQNNNTLTNVNEYEGRFALEVWKYNPLTLVGELNNDLPVVDPLSLYLSLKESKNERVEMALEQIIEKYTW